MSLKVNKQLKVNKPSPAQHEDEEGDEGGEEEGDDEAADAHQDVVPRLRLVLGSVVLFAEGIVGDIFKSIIASSLVKGCENTFVRYSANRIRFARLVLGDNVIHNMVFLVSGIMNMYRVIVLE